MDTTAELIHLARTSIEAYREKLSSLLAEGDLTWADVDAVDDMLIEGLERGDDVALQAEQVSRAHLELLSGEEFEMCRGYAYNTLFLALRRQGRFREALAAARDGLGMVTPRRFEAIGRSLIGNLHAWRDSEGFPDDERVRLISICTQHFLRLKNYSAAAHTFIDAAGEFSTMRIFQAAWRALADAEELIQEHSLVDVRPSFLNMVGIVYFEEGEAKDLPRARSAYREIFEYHAERGTQPTIHVMANAATIELRSGNAAGARDIFRDILAREDLTELERFQARTNLAAAERDAGDLRESAKVIEQTSVSPEAPHELQAEFHLIAARTMSLLNRPSDVLQHLTQAVAPLDRRMRDVGRLHVRRELRNDRASRIRALLQSIPPEGPAEAITPVLSFLLGGTIRDWLSLLTWQDEVLADERVSQTLKDRLQESIRDVTRQGAPITYGFREKYDDPYELDEVNGIPLPGYGKPWHELNAVTTEILEQRPGEGPFDGALSHHLSREILRLVQDTVLFVPMATPERYLGLTIAGRQYTLRSVDREPFTRYLTSLFEFDAERLPRGQFHAALTDVLPAVQELVLDSLRLVGDRSFRRVTIRTDAISELLPWPAAFAESSTFRQRATDGTLTLEFSPVFVTKSGEIIASTEVPAVGIYDSKSSLTLSAAELDMVERQMGTSVFRVDLATQDADSRPNSRLLHVATHGKPLTRYRDPAFGQLDDRKPWRNLSLFGEQDKAADSPVALAFLNVCYGSRSTWKNYADGNLANESLGFATVFLLNRQAATITARWPITDVAAYLFARLFYARFARTRDPATAWSSTVAAAFELHRTSAIELASEIEDASAREVALAALRDGPEHPLAAPHLIGAYSFTTLLPPLQRR